MRAEDLKVQTRVAIEERPDAAILENAKPPIDMVSYPSGDTGWNYAVSASNESKGVTVWFFVGCAVAR